MVDSLPVVSAPDLKIRKTLGRSYLDENRVEEAAQLFSAILQDYPDDVDSLVAMGNLYLAAGEGEQARRFYERALWLDPHNDDLRRQIEKAWSESWNLQSQPLPNDPASVGRLLQRLTGRQKEISEEELNRAAGLLYRILHAENPAREIAERLDEMDEILPALLEINIRQAQADGNTEIEQALRSLQSAIQTRMNERDESTTQAEEDKQPFSFAEWKVLLLESQPFGRANRVALLESALQQAGAVVERSLNHCLQEGQLPDLIIAPNPHLKPENLEGIVRLTGLGVPLLVDLETDFEQLPVNHPAYAEFGLGTPARGKAYASALLLADCITVPSPLQAESLCSAGRPAVYVPDGWMRTNFLWLQEGEPRETIHLGWVAGPSQSEDLASIRRAVVRVMREFPQTRLVVIGDYQAYHLFDILPENRRMYLPMTGVEEFPYLLEQVDILMIPLRNHPYNDSISDQILVEAGIKAIPWVGSPVVPLSRWMAGGRLAGSIDEWHLHLRELVMDRDHRQGMGLMGRKIALSRESSEVTLLWLRTLEKTIRSARGSFSAETGRTLA
ncbi:MAG: tetratricopeptide repeat protein [Chloroflexota bacterium]